MTVLSIATTVLSRPIDPSQRCLDERTDQRMRLLGPRLRDIQHTNEKRVCTQLDDADFTIRAGARDRRSVGLEQRAAFRLSPLFIWNVWVSLSPTSYQQFLSVFSEDNRSGAGPFFGWLESHSWIYPETINLKTRVHLRNNGIRPNIELEPTAHPLAREQSEGINAGRVVEIFEAVTHPPDTTE